MLIFMQNNLSLSSFYNWLGKLKFIPFVFVILLFSYIIFIPFLIFEFFVPNIAENLTDVAQKVIEKEKGFLGAFIVSCIIVPVLETFLLQFLPIQTLQKFFKQSILFPILISAMLFALTHFYDILYVILMFLIGIVYAVGFVVYGKQRTVRHAFWAIALAHSLANCINLLFNLG